jgi:hypothetical protein
VLRKIFGPKRREDKSWRKLHNDKLHALYCSPNIVKVIKSGRMRWMGHVACMWRGEVFTGFWLEDLKGTDQWEDLGIGKVKVKLSLCLTKHHVMKTYWGSGGIAPRILDLCTRWR